MTQDADDRFDRRDSVPAAEYAALRRWCDQCEAALIGIAQLLGPLQEKRPDAGTKRPQQIEHT